MDVLSKFTHYKWRIKIGFVELNINIYPYYLGDDIKHSLLLGAYNDRIIYLLKDDEKEDISVKFCKMTKQAICVAG